MQMYPIGGRTVQAWYLRKFLPRGRFYPGHRSKVQQQRLFALGANSFYIIKRGTAHLTPPPLAIILYSKPVCLIPQPL